MKTMLRKKGTMSPLWPVQPILSTRKDMELVSVSEDGSVAVVRNPPPAAEAPVPAPAKPVVESTGPRAPVVPALAELPKLAADPVSGLTIDPAGPKGPGLKGK
jgi:hypothetical protein